MAQLLLELWLFRCLRLRQSWESSEKAILLFLWARCIFTGTCTLPSAHPRQREGGAMQHRWETICSSQPRRQRAFPGRRRLLSCKCREGECREEADARKRHRSKRPKVFNEIGHIKNVPVKVSNERQARIFTKMKQSRISALIVSKRRAWSLGLNNNRDARHSEQLDEGGCCRSWTKSCPEVPN